MTQELVGSQAQSLQAHDFSCAPKPSLLLLLICVLWWAGLLLDRRLKLHGTCTLNFVLCKYPARTRRWPTRFYVPLPHYIAYDISRLPPRTLFLLSLSHTSAIAKLLTAAIPPLVLPERIVPHSSPDTFKGPPWACQFLDYADSPRELGILGSVVSLHLTTEQFLRRRNENVTGIRNNTQYTS